MTGGGRPRRRGQNGVPLVDSERRSVGSRRNGWKRVRRLIQNESRRRWSEHANRRGSSTSSGRSEIAPNEEQGVRYRDSVYGCLRSESCAHSGCRLLFAGIRARAARGQQDEKQYGIHEQQDDVRQSARSRGVITPNPCCHTRRRQPASRPSRWHRRVWGFARPLAACR